MRKLLVQGLASSLVLFSLAFAQTADTTTTEAVSTSTDLSTAQEISPTDLGVVEPSAWQFFKRRFTKVFTFDAVKDAKLDLELANLTFLQARKEAAVGDTQSAAELIDRYNSQIGAIEQRIETISSRLPGDNTQVHSLLDQVAEKHLLTASALDRMSLKATGEFNKKLTQAKVEALKDISKVLAKENLTPEKMAEKLNKISEKLAEKETDAGKKFAKRVSVVDGIADSKEFDNDDFDQAIEGARKKHIDDIVRQPNLGDVVKALEGSSGKHLIVLQEVLNRAPDKAKSAIQAVIDREIEKVSTDALKDKKAFDNALHEDKEGHADIKKQISDRFKEKVRDNEELKKDLEKRDKKIQEAKEKFEEKLEQREERKIEHQESSPSTHSTTPSTSTSPTPDTSTPSTSTAPTTTTTPSTSTTSPTTTPTTTTAPSSSQTTTSPTPTTTTTPTTTVSTPKIYDVSFKDGKFVTSNLHSEGIAVGDSIRFRNESEESVQIQSNPHPTHDGLAALNVGVLAKGQEKTVKFEKTGLFSWHNHLNTSVTASVTVH